jgi:hypothetical protein
MSAAELADTPSNAYPIGPTRWVAAAILGALGLYGTGVFLDRFAEPSQLPSWIRLAFSVVTAVFLLWSFLIDRPSRRLSTPLDLLWVAPLAFLPLLSAPAIKNLIPIGVILFAAGFLNGWRREARHGKPGGLLWATDEGHLDSWTGFLLAIAVFGSLSQIVTAYHSASEGMDNDGLYYLGVARYMALHHAFREPIVWHFLAPPAQVIHPPGDYWGPMAPVLLSLPMMLFGANGNVGALTVSAVAALVNILFWYLVCFALPLRHRVAQLAAVVLFTFSPRVEPIRLQTESVIFFHLFMVLALVLFFRRKGALALVSAFCAMLTRGDGIVSLGILGGLLVFQAAQEGAGDRYRRLRRILWTVLCLIAVYFTWTFASFGKPFPPATEMTPRLGDYFDVYVWDPSHRKPLTAFSHRFDPHYIAERWSLFIETFTWKPFFKADMLWLLLAALAGLSCFRPKRRLNECLVFWLALPGYFLVIWASGVAFHKWRTPMELLPVFVLAGAIGFDLVIDGLGKLRRTVGGPALRLATLAAQTGLVALIVVQALADIKPYEAKPREERVYPLDVALGDVLGHSVVATDYPWRIIGFTQSPAVSVPMDGAQAIEEVFKKYHVEYLVIYSRPLAFWWRESKAVISALSQKLKIGSLTFEPVPFSGPATIYRVHGTE